MDIWLNICLRHGVFNIFSESYFLYQNVKLSSRTSEKHLRNIKKSNARRQLTRRF